MFRPKTLLKQIEQVGQELPAVGDVAVVGVPDDYWGEQVAAFIKPAPGHTATGEELTAYCRAHLAAHKTPRHWVFTDAFPLTGSGKVQKSLLREQFTSGHAPALPAAALRRPPGHCPSAHAGRDGYPRRPASLTTCMEP